MDTSKSVGQNALDAFRRHIESYRDFPLELEAREEATIVRPRGVPGFEVRVYEGEDGDAVVAAGRWHGHFDDPEEAAAVGGWLLTPYYRIAEELKGGNLVATWIEYWTPRGWEGDQPVFFLNPVHKESWLPTGPDDFFLRYRQQAIAPEPYDYALIEPDAELVNGLPPDWFEGERVEPRAESEARLFVTDDSGDFEA